MNLMASLIAAVIACCAQIAAGLLPLLHGLSRDTHRSLLKVQLSCTVQLDLRSLSPTLLRLEWSPHNKPIFHDAGTFSP